MSDIPQSFAEITPQWLTTVLQLSGQFERPTVVACKVEQVGEEFGFASAVGRVTLTYDSAESRAPRSIIAKLAATGSNRELSEIFEEKCRSEAAFYRTIWPDTGIRTPDCYYVAHQTEPTRFIALLEDLHDARFGDAAKGCTMREAELVVEGLAALHARWWNEPRLSGFDWLPTFGDVATRIEQLGERRPVFLERYRQYLSSESEEATRRLAPRHLPLLASVQGPPETLLHVDTHLDNIAFLGTDDDLQVVLFDWQGVSKGLCAVDVAAFVSGAIVDPDATKETELLKRYHDHLLVGGVDDYPLDRFLLDYRIALLRWWMGTVNGFGSSYADSWTGRQADLAQQSVLRWNTAIRDHHLAELL
jgi:aminoglycoside/choline kinase family phosphotransferase